MFNQRTDPYYLAIRALARDGTLGPIRRVSWIITNWFRSDAYYASGSWRATWRGEGGGVLLNQCPHNLDLFSWMFGQPRCVRAFCGFGRYHDIEVEDDVTAYLELPGGATATFITSTGEAPGTNRLEVTADNGRLVMEGDRLVFTENEVPTSEFCRTTKENFAAPKTTERVLPSPATASSTSAS
ncbi:MAG: Gfo/Idh/MocA family oxidoreductase [Verrucomicrobiota bacterium]